MKELDIDTFLEFMIFEIRSNRQATYTLSSNSSIESIPCKVSMIMAVWECLLQSVVLCADRVTFGRFPSSSPSTSRRERMM